MPAGISFLARWTPPIPGELNSLREQAATHFKINFFQRAGFKKTAALASRSGSGEIQILSPRPFTPFEIVGPQKRLKLLMQ
jgi:hypothetical protein